MLPTLVGCSVMVLWYTIMLWQNDGRIVLSEIKIVFVELALSAVIGLYQYIVYRISMKQGEKVVITDEGI